MSNILRVGALEMNNMSNPIIKNGLDLIGFDAIGQEAADLVIEKQRADDIKPWLSIAFLSLSNTYVVDIVDWLKPLQIRARLAKRPIVLAIHISELILTCPQERLAFLDDFGDLVDSVILIPKLDKESPAQALARFPQFIISVVYGDGMIMLDAVYITDGLRPSVAFFGYSIKQKGEAMAVAVDAISQQWQNNYLPPANIQRLLGSYDCYEEDISLADYEELDRAYHQSACMFNARNAPKSQAMLIKRDDESEDMHFNLLLFGLEFL